jgi:hypothetical protein
MRSLLLLLLVGCAADPPPGDDPTAGAHVRMDFDGGGFWDAPWPSSHRFTDGALDLAAFPNPDGVGFVDDLIALADGVLSGAGTTSAVAFRLEVPPDPASLPDLRGSLEAGASVFLVDVDRGSPGFGARVPVDVAYARNAAPFGDTDLLTLLPLQGVPMRPGTAHAAVITRDLLDVDGWPFGHAPELDAAELPPGYADALTALEALGTPRERVAGLAAFTTQDPEAELRAVHADLRARPLPALSPFAPAETFDDYCVFEATLDLPVYQEGEPPYSTEGGTFAWDGDVPALHGTETARAVLTVPRGEAPAGGWPVVAFVRTGGGGDRPLVDRGVRDADGVASVGTGYARDFAAVGFAGFSLDGPHGGLRNVTGGDEQFLMFNIGNPGAMRDNVRQSAVELTLIPDLLDGLEAPGCGVDAATFDVGHLALFGHSMGATIGPLTLALEPRFGAAVFSGGGGSWIENVVHKQSPLEVRPIAEAMLRYADYGASLTEADPVLSLLQWAGESADPPVWSRSIRGHGTRVLMLQGIVDTYILPPMANALSLSLGLDLAGDPRDEVEPRLAAYRPLGALIDLGGGEAVALPHTVPDERAGAVVQHLEDGVEDGHEAAFQQPDARRQVRCFLTDFAADRAPTISGGDGPCP